MNTTDDLTVVADFVSRKNYVEAVSETWARALEEAASLVENDAYGLLTWTKPNYCANMYDGVTSVDTDTTFTKIAAAIRALKNKPALIPITDAERAKYGAGT